MAGTNDFKAVATGGGANVLTQSAYAALTTFLSNGYSSGIVASDQFNKIIRQSSFMAAVIGQFVADSGTNAVDDGDIAGFVADFISALRTFTVLPGTIIDFAGTSAPTGFLACPMSQTNISRTTYAALFAAIGTTWGAGDGSTTFGMPWFPADYAAIQANSNVGSSTVGQVISHTHTLLTATVFQSGTMYGFNGAGSNFSVSSTGGAANLAAGVRTLKCVKY